MGPTRRGGYLVYRINRGGWQSVNPPAFAPHSDVGSGQSLNQFWKATFTMPATVGSTVEYYFIADFNNRTRTFVHSGNTVGTVESAAQANPFSFTVAPPRPVFTVNGANGDYSKSNFYLDENNDPTFPTSPVRVNPGIAAQVAPRSYRAACLSPQHGNYSRGRLSCAR